MLVFRDCQISEIEDYLHKIGMQLEQVDFSESIPGSFWGDSEAGLIGNKVFVRPDTPFHSFLHETCHYICMSDKRRQTLHTNAIGNTKGNYTEENAVCYLQILLAETFSFYTKDQIFTEMDEWGYSFRLGSSQSWFLNDAQDAHVWLNNHNLIDSNNTYQFVLRMY